MLMAFAAPRKRYRTGVILREREGKIEGGREGERKEA